LVRGDPVRVAELEARVIRGRATPEEAAELSTLRSELPQTGSAAIEQALRSLKAAQPLPRRSWTAEGGSGTAARQGRERLRGLSP
jgi:hypothetical protein